MKSMSIEPSKRICPVALTALAIMCAPSVAHADIRDYEFRLVEKQFKKGDAVVAVRLIRKANGEAVSDAVIFATRLDMAPEGMETMTTSIEAAPDVRSGVYSFKTSLSMEGDWRLSLAAKIQGESSTLESRLVLRALP